MAKEKFTLAHITHEAVDHIGGIGTVLAGLITSKNYQSQVRRTILVGPIQDHLATDPESRLGDGGTVLYSSIDKIDRVNLASKLRPVEWAFNVAIVYGKRPYRLLGEDVTGEAEVLLIDVFQTNPDRLNVFKLRLWQTFGLDSSRYEKSWDYEEYVRLAEPAFYALTALLNDQDLPCIMFGHEFMGMPAALAAILDGQEKFLTVFHAHECATARHIVEGHPGHDTMFYNVLNQSRHQNRYLEDVFGDHDHLLRHALVKRAHLCDGIIAVGDRTRDELLWLDPHFSDVPIDLVYNGLPVDRVDIKSKLQCRQMLLDYSRLLVGSQPDVLMTHVTRPVISKGLWRDLKVCHALDERFVAMGKTAVLYILTTAGGVRRSQDVQAMEKHYGWPITHREGYPDLVGPEVSLNRDIETFNNDHQAIRVVLVNQFGWSRGRIGSRLPEGMTMGDFRRATDVEFGLATYEPFGISPLEPLGCGALCVVSSVCGCQSFVNYVSGSEDKPNVIKADFTQLDRVHCLDELMGMTQAQRDHIEHRVAGEVARQLFDRLPWTDGDRALLLDAGQTLADQMNWDRVVENSLMPMLERITARGHVETVGARVAVGV